MKKYLIGIFAAALAFGTSAYTTEKKTHADPVYDFVFDGTPADTFVGTRDEAVIHFGCNTGSTTCALAYEQGGGNRIPELDLKKN